MREGWEIRDLEGCISFIKNGANIKQTKNACGFPITRIETLSGGKFNRDKMGYANLFELGKYSGYVLNDGDVLLSHINSKSHVGRSVVYTKEGEETIIHGMNLLRIIPKKDVNPFFLYYYTLSHRFKKQIISIRKDAVNQSSVAIGDLKRVSVPVPPIREQEKVVAELNCLTDIIEKKKQQLKELDNLAQSIFYEMFGDPITNEKGWEISCFGKVMSPSKVKKCKERKDLPILSITMRNGIVRQSERFKKVIASTDTSAYKIVPRGALVIAFPIDEGLIYVQDIEEEGIMSPAYSIWDVDYSQVQGDYIVAYFHSAYAMKYYKDKLRGTTQRRRMLAKDDLLSMPIPVPSMTKQEQFHQALKSIKNEKELVEKSLEKVDFLFNSRMDYWFN